MLVRLNGVAVDLELARNDGDERGIRRCERVFNRERQCVTFADLLDLMGWTPEDAKKAYGCSPIEDPLARWEEWKRENNAPAYAHAFLCQHLIIRHDATHVTEQKTRMTKIRVVLETVGERLRLITKPTSQA